MFASNDPFYNRPLRHECEYFQNVITMDDRLFIQNLIFDNAFELDFDFQLLQVHFKEIPKNNLMHITSNPNFAFHDDVFPGFAKNTVFQKKFHKHECGDKQNCKIIIPFNELRITEKLRHLSTIIFRKNWKIHFEIKCSAIPRGILELRSNDESFVLRILITKERSISFDFKSERSINNSQFSCLENWQKIEIGINNGFWEVRSITGRFKEIYSLIGGSSISTDLSEKNKSRIEVYAKGSDIYLRSFYYYHHKEVALLEFFWF